MLSTSIPTYAYEQMGTIFGGACATGWFSLGSNEPLGVNST
jgi:hypothetical protein